MSGIQQKLERVRRSRVVLKFEVEEGDALVEKELPFVVGVMGDFSGDPRTPLKPYAERRFTEVDRDNFDKVMAQMAPGLTMKVDNTLAGDGSQFQVDLAFKKLDDFEPAAIVEQVEPLRRLREARDQLRDLLAKADRSENLENLLEQILQDADAIQQVDAELKGKAPNKGDA